MTTKALKLRRRNMNANRIVKEMGFDWFEQIENAPGADSAVNR
jgi:hypothetical protein